MSQIKLPIISPNPSTTAVSIRKTIFQSFLLQLDEAHRTGAAYLKDLVDSGNIVMSADGEVEEISEALEDVLFKRVDEITRAIGFTLLRDSSLNNISSEGTLEPLNLVDFLRSQEVEDEPTKFLKVSCTLTVGPANAEETANAALAYAASTSQAH